MRSLPIMVALALSLLSPGTVSGGQALCQAFFDEQEFLSYNQSHGKFKKGLETFEEGVVVPGGKNCFPAPLGPVPSSYFPNGLQERNLIIQDNITTGPNPAAPNPSGNPCALFLIGAGFAGSNSNKVGEDLFVKGIPASLDLIFTEPNHTGVGFRLSRFEGFPTGGWHITVYDKSDVPIGKFDVPGPTPNEPNKGFFGVWCDQTIGRINIYDQAGVTPDAIDDIWMWEEAPTKCTAFFDEQQFRLFNESHGKFKKGLETFEEGVVVPGGKNCFPAPLGPVPSPYFPNGLEERNLIIQDNVTTGPNPDAPNPSGNPCALFLIGAGFAGSNSNKVGEDLFLKGIPASLDLIFTEPNHTGVGFRLSRFEGFPTGGWHITIYNKADEPIGKFDVAGPTANEPFKGFFGVWCDQTLGRINIYDQAGVTPDAIDDIWMWEEEPTPVHVTTWGGVKLIYR